ncbi:MAG: right-handed parallel beta-helix repeat-containing protein, partial [Methanobacterium sp.]
KDKGDGGGIYNSGVLTLYNTYIQSNLAKNSASQRVGDANGGGIYNTGTLNVYNCTFYDNTARNADDYADQIAGYGGAIFSTGFLNVVNCSFNSNKANEGYGGAIYYKNSTGLNIVNSTFTGNNAYGFDPNTEYYFRDDYGGAIYCNSNGGLSVTNSIFINNAAWGDGGAIYNTGGPLTLKNCTFTNNCANYGVITLGEVGAYGGHGGAIYNNNNLVMTNCTLNNNVAMYGGALYCTGNGTYSVTNCSFNNNTVKAVDDNGNPLQVVTYSITGGWKAFVAATIKSISKTMLIYKISPKQGITSIVGNIVDIVKMINPNKDDVEAAGGAIYMLQSVSLSVNNCAFTDNTASLGGGICNFGNGTLTIKNSEFTGNAAGVGGAVYSNYLGPLNVTSNIFNGNCAHGGGAIGYTGSDSSQWGNLTVQENIFRNNDASLGGTVYDNFQGNTKIHMNFNLIYGTENYDIYDEVGKADVALNWWGINTGPSTYNVYGNITTSPWMVLTINSPDVYIGSNSTINFDMLHDSNGDYPNPAYGIVPNGIPVSLIVSNGTITSSMLTLINGIASTTYIANGNSGPVTINYTVDNNDHYLFSSTFNVLQIPTNIYLNSVGNFAGQNVTLVAKVTDNKDKLINGGNVTFHINIAPTITVPVINGYAEYYLKIPEFTQSLPYPISADYNGTNIYASSLATGSLYVNQAFPGSTGITVGPPVNGTQGQTVNLIAQLIDANNYQPLANKSLAFSVNGTNVGSAITDSNGVASLFYRILLVPGSYTILASFAADSPYTTSSNTGMLNVNPSPTGVSSLTITRNVQSIISLGDNFIVTIKIGNNGPDIAKDVVINFSIPEGLEFITASVDQGTWSYDESTRLFTWNLGDVAVGDPYLYLTLNAKKLGQYLLNHILTTLSYDPNLENQMTPLNIVITTPEENNGKESSVNAASKTIGMQETGLPVAGLILAILALLGGVASLKRK